MQAMKAAISFLSGKMPNRIILILVFLFTSHVFYGQEEGAVASEPSSKMGFFMYMPSELANWSLYAGQKKGGFGWFVGFRSDFFGITDEVGYEVSGSSRTSELNDAGYTDAADHTTEKTSVTFGILKSVAEDWLFLYTGAGFGMYSQYDLYDEYLYDYTGNYWEWNQKVWLKNEDKSIMGIEFEGGVLFDAGPLLSAGFTSTNFQHFKWTMGIGFQFHEMTRKKKEK